MASAGAPATPVRPLPGAFLATPAPGQGSTIFAANNATLNARQQPAPTASDAPGAAAHNAAHSTPVQTAADTINRARERERNFPEMETYISQGVSGEYELPSSPAWLPFQKLKMHDLPQRLLEQANHSGMGMQMGIFPPLAHAWVALDNCLYLWDYTMPNPEIIGFEENSQPITAVKLVTPKPGVFVADIKHLIVICTATEMLLLGVAAQTTPTGAQTVALYNTKMKINVKGIGVKFIAASQKTGRIFFAGSFTDDIYEFYYQQDEGWFRGQCQKVCHTKKGLNYVSENIHAVGHYFGPQTQSKKLVQLVIDDSRNLMYSLSNTSEIKVWLVKKDLEQSLSRPLAALLQNTGHFNSRTELLTGRDVAISALSAIPATESRKLTLLATTTTGCRLYLSLTRGYGYQADAQNPPSSMQVLHIRFPPKDPNAPAAAAQPGSTAMPPYSQPGGQVDSNSKYLTPTSMAYRFLPGYWMAFQPHPEDPQHRDRVFCVAPDMVRLQNRSDAGPWNAKFAEYGQWIDLPAEMQQVMSMTPDFNASDEPLGFGNEMAVQFDQPASEFAIVTLTGIQTIRRRRLVDNFAAMLKYGSSDNEGVEGDIKRFIRLYGREETAATALAVACGQGMDVSENRVATVTDPEVIEKARKAFIEHGGHPEYNANADLGSTNPEDNTRPSPRHDGMALYISRLVRSIWAARIVKDASVPGAGAKLEPTVKLDKLRSIQRDLAALREFLDRNKSFIEGLAGPQALSRVTTVQEEHALKGEHKKMHSLVQLISSISEGISFVLVLFDEQIEEILALIPEASREKTKQLTFESLFVSASGRELAKELVKAIVNRNIANGSNVDTVAEALRRRCGSFCSADDVIIFKAQEQLERARAGAPQSEAGRLLLNDSSRLFQKVAANLTNENLDAAVKIYIETEFYAGAIQLCLTVAHEKDPAKRALSWMRDGMPENDQRSEAYQARTNCYWLIFHIIAQLDSSTANIADVVDGKNNKAMRRRSEAYDVINNSDDVVFLTCLYDWYVGQHQAERLLEINNSYVVEYLKNRATNSRAHADLLWRYFAAHHDYLQAAEVQLVIAKSSFDDLNLADRIGYLSRARTNASTRQTILTDSRQSKQKVLREVSDLLEIANIQDEIMQRIKDEPRMNDDARAKWTGRLNGVILPLEELFTQYADMAQYHDICLLIFQAADHRNPADIQASWQGLITTADHEAPARHNRQAARWEAVGVKVREVGLRVHNSPSVFPIQTIYRMLEAYALAAPHESSPPPTWPVEVFLSLEVPYETLLPAQEQIYYSNEAPFTGSKRRRIASNMVFLLVKWFEASERSGERVLFGSEENVDIVSNCLANLLRADMDAPAKQAAENLVAKIQRAMS